MKHCRWLVRSAWHVIAWSGIALLLYLSLSPQPIEISAAHGDKYGHVFAYMALVYWWAQLEKVALPVLVMIFEVMGIIVEFAQGMTGWRSFDVLDIQANTIGVIAGAVLATCIPNILRWLESTIKFDHLSTA
jgi:hypothetical protein